MLDKLKRLLGRGTGHAENGQDSSSGVISCDEVRSNLYEYIDQELDSVSAARVKKHLDACPDCYPLAKFETKFVESIQRVTGQATAGPDLQRRVLDALAKEPPLGE